MIAQEYNSPTVSVKTIIQCDGNAIVFRVSLSSSNVKNSEIC